MVLETEQPGMNVSAVARKYEVHPNPLFRWRRLFQEGALTAVRADEELVPCPEVKELKMRIRELEHTAGPQDHGDRDPEGCPGDPREK